MTNECLVAGNGMRRAEAVVMHGSHWVLRMSEPPAVREVLGRDFDGSRSFDVVEKAAIDVRERNARRELDRSRRLLGNVRSRVVILMARLGLHRRSAQILEAIPAHRATIERCRAELADDGWRPERIPLPEVVAVPPTLPIGTAVWEVGHEWPLEHGVRLRELRVSGIGIYDVASGNGWDYSIDHRLERVTRGPGTPASTPMLEAMPEGPCVPVPDRMIVSSRLFMTKEAAADYMEVVADELAIRVVEARSVAAGILRQA